MGKFKRYRVKDKGWIKAGDFLRLLRLIFFFIPLVSQQQELQLDASTRCALMTSGDLRGSHSHLSALGRIGGLADWVEGRTLELRNLLVEWPFRNWPHLCGLPILPSFKSNSKWDSNELQMKSKWPTLNNPIAIGLVLFLRPEHFKFLGHPLIRLTLVAMPQRSSIDTRPKWLVLWILGISPDSLFKMIVIRVSLYQ